LRYIQEHGFEVLLICSPGEELEALAISDGVKIVPIPMQREIALLQDAVSLWKLLRALRKLKPDIVNASTPKAGFLGMLAAYITRVPIRIYTLRAWRMETLEGLKRFVLYVTEWVASTCAHRVVCISESLRQVSTGLGPVPAAKTVVIRSGRGIDTARFLDTENMQRAEVLREQLRIPQGAPVIGFVGRITQDKGIRELFDAFEEVLAVFPEARLLLVGRFEEGDPVPLNYVRRLRSHRQVILAGWVKNPILWFYIMDILAFPSYREGFGNVALEAGAAGIPVVGFHVTGLIDAVVHGETGILVPMGDSGALARALIKLLEDDALRERLGETARARVMQDFAVERIWEAWLELYKRELALRRRYGKGSAEAEPLPY